MSRSRKKVSISTLNSRTMKLWKRSVNKIIRHRAKQLLRTTTDFDSLVMPIQNDGGTLWDSPRDGGGVPRNVNVIINTI
jgi:hypothetical protein